MFDYIFDLLFYQFPRYIYAQRNCKICCRFVIITFCNTIISIENFVSYLTLQFLKPSTVKLKLNLHFFANWIVQFIHHKISRTNPVLFTLEILPLNHTNNIIVYHETCLEICTRIKTHCISDIQVEETMFWLFPLILGNVCFSDSWKRAEERDQRIGRTDGRNEHEKGTLWREGSEFLHGNYRCDVFHARARVTSEQYFKRVIQKQSLYSAGLGEQSPLS